MVKEDGVTATATPFGGGGGGVLKLLLDPPPQPLRMAHTKTATTPSMWRRRPFEKLRVGSRSPLVNAFLMRCAYGPDFATAMRLASTVIPRWISISIDVPTSSLTSGPRF